MSLFRTQKNYKCLFSALRKGLMSTFRISYFPHFYHWTLSAKRIDNNNWWLSSKNLRLLQQKPAIR